MAMTGAVTMASPRNVECDARPLTFTERVDSRVAQDTSRALAGQRLKELIDKNPEVAEMIGLVVDLGLFYN